ncbi:MAG: hypothetical protein KKH73_05870 [Actinobacteria bacterium]|nr:hypothetical protein [Actinomycetota bacterium]MCG2794528.1 C4-type zinc ribbon domain-containing protein [Actinomycetes bacterium]
MSDIGPGELGETLRDIQNLDTEILGLRREIEGLAEKYNLDGLLGRLGEARKAQASAQKDLDGLKHDQHKLDGELDLLSSKIKKEEEKLFSGTVMNPKELSAIQVEILGLRKKSDKMETEDLEMMEAIDRGNLEVEKTGQQAEESSADERKARDEYDRELAEKEHQVREFEGKRDVLKRGVEEETLALYEKLLESKGGLAVAVIDQGRNCGGCHIEFSRTQIDRFQHGEGMFRCEYCRRILVK